MVLQAEIPQNLIPNDPDLSFTLSMHRKGIFLDLNCHHVGTIQSFDATNQTAKVTINYKRTYFRPNTAGIVMPELRDYPVIADAPVMFLGGGGYSMTFPVSAGDECLVMFNDRDIDAWFAGSSSSPNQTARLHSFADAVALVGIRSLPNVISDFDEDGIVLRNEDGDIKLTLRNDGTVRMENPDGSFELGSTGDLRMENDNGSIQLSSDGKIRLENSGSFDLLANGDVDFDTGTVTGLFGNSGKVKFQNSTGEMIAVLYDMLNALTTAVAGGFPLIIPPAYATALTKFTSFKT